MIGKHMIWIVTTKESADADLRWFGRKLARAILRKAIERLEANPLAETANLKTLRPNPVAQRELRIKGRYRVLFNVDEAAGVADIVVVGEKRGSLLFVQGEEYREHHESNPTE